MQDRELELLSADFRCETGLLKTNPEGHWVIFPGPARQITIVPALHDVYVDVGSGRLLQIARTHYYWPRLATDINTYVSSCLSCQLTKITYRRKKGSPPTLHQLYQDHAKGGALIWQPTYPTQETRIRANL